MHLSANINWHKHNRSLLRTKKTKQNSYLFDFSLHWYPDTFQFQFFHNPERLFHSKRNKVSMLLIRPAIFIAWPSSNDLGTQTWQRYVLRKCICMLCICMHKTLKFPGQGYINSENTRFIKQRKTFFLKFLHVDSKFEPSHLIVFLEPSMVPQTMGTHSERTEWSDCKDNC